MFIVEHCAKHICHSLSTIPHQFDFYVEIEDLFMYTKTDEETDPYMKEIKHLYGSCSESFSKELRV